jgi:hypothetical protein
MVVMAAEPHYIYKKIWLMAMIAFFVRVYRFFYNHWLGANAQVTRRITPLTIDQ